jgi:tRNA A37 methylthiotransferase MiaB
MPDQVPPAQMRERNRTLRELGARKKHEFMESFVGRKLPAITLAAQPEAGEGTEALSDNYLRIRLRGRHQTNRWVQVYLEDRAQDDVLVGHLV